MVQKEMMKSNSYTEYYNRKNVFHLMISNITWCEINLAQHKK
jgi:hypothetical protein